MRCGYYGSYCIGGVERVGKQYIYYSMYTYIAISPTHPLPLVCIPGVVVE